MSNGHVRLVAVGDIQPNRREPETLFRHVASVLSRADLRVGQLECTISDKGELRTDVRNPSHRVPPHNIEALTAAEFDAVTFAGNNNLDFGVQAFEDTIDRLESHHIAVVGAGRNLSSAVSPVTIDRNGLKIAMLSFCSILPRGYAATSSRPGIAPLEVQTFYEPVENIYEQPGTPAKTITLAKHDDLARVLETIRQARASADVVITSFHWGVHFTFDLAMYQPEVAYAAIEAGSDLVIGTHPHCLQAVDLYRGKPIFYSLGNFAFEQPGEVALKGASSYLSLYGIPAGVAVPGHPHPAHCRPSAILECELSSKGLDSATLIPTYLNDHCEPELVHPGSAEHKECVDLLQSLSADIGTNLEVDGGVLRLNLGESKTTDTRELIRRRRISYPSLRRLSTLDV